jgi:dihydroorotase
LIADSVLTNAKVYLKGEIVDCCFAIEEGKILKIGKETHMPKADEKTDLHNLLVLPGVIDSHVHLRDEEKAYKRKLSDGHGGCTAAGGGTTVLDMPNNSPVTMSAEALRNRMQMASRRVFVNVGFYSEFPENLGEIQGVVAEGALGFKLFMAEQVGGLNIDDDLALKKAFIQTGELGVPVAVHAEDHLLLKKAIEHLKLAKRNGIAAFLKAHDEHVELTAVERVLGIAAKVEKAHLHFCHLSTKKALAAVGEAKKAGTKVTCEVTPHNLLLIKDDYERFGVAALTMPPLRTKENVEALWNGVAEGTVDTIGSDHAPHTLQEKDAAIIWDVKVGISGLETTLPLLLTLVHQDRLTLARAIELLSEKPAEIFHLPEKGRLEQGKNADLVTVDFNAKFRIDASKFKSKAKFSPLNQWDVQGKPVKTFVNGKLVMDEGEIVAKPASGSVIRRPQA